LRQNRLCRSGKEGNAVICHQPKAQFAQPAIPTEEIPAKTMIFREVNMTLQDDAEEFDDDYGEYQKFCSRHNGWRGCLVFIWCLFL
jgi:hypothetical protein